ncbi:MAG: carbamoyltransferase HypF [Proteobacteria bacterium]|nr:carbamoyltransferase HypF [Pseudomonadota bacterium]MBU1641190.1 carbamoyltransferase HypF [Pseudomonadota bacterium]
MVQGVGFRPHVYRLATHNGLCGLVANSLAGVELVLEGAEAKITLFIETLLASPPPGAIITRVTEQNIPAQHFSAFTIAPSLTGGTPAPLAPADFGMCAECERELLDAGNHRFQHPFISCTACGPRFTLLRGLPYDRSLTTMAAFPLCPICQKEYDDPSSRRFHAEPICCPNCGPRLLFYDKNGTEATNPLHKTAALLTQGKVVAIKGVGGFHLAADACNQTAVARLRAIKQRPDKPLAIMVRDLETAATLVHVSRDAADLLCSSPRPIVILPFKSATPLAGLIAPGLAEVGIMLAYTPLHYLLFDQAPRVLVMTSFNKPGSPMLTSTSEALRRLGSACDAVLSHPRKIINRCDDSVIRMHADQAQMLRRSRGYAPLPIDLGMESPSILACGAGEKVTICLSRGSLAFLSQHVGETRSPAGQHHYQAAATNLQALLHITPQSLAHDLHPDYYSTRFALAYPGVQKIAVQHHHAHIASCMAENKIDRAVIGLALDGTGLGSDGTLWGGEILRCTLSAFSRLAHFAPLAMPGAEAAIKEPWRLALAWLHDAGLPHSDLAFLHEIPASKKEMLREMLDRGVNCPVTSSLGRLFDAVAALINLRGRITFSAQAAMELEAICDPHEHGTYPFAVSRGLGGAPSVMETSDLLQGIVNDLDRGTGQGIIAARFHNTIIAMLAKTCARLAREQGIDEVACSGGVFQNRIISQGLQKALREAGLTVYCHHNIPCNDGGLALGQIAVAAALHALSQESSTSLVGTRHA